jgi:diguanylate cyclase (GGDEF)-like protein
MLLVGAGAISLHNLGKLPSNLFTTNALLIGSALEMLLLSFALAERINVTRREKALAQADAIAAKQSMVDSLRASERLLELHVAQRTGELVQANARLKEHESLLKQQAHYDALTGLPNRKLLSDRLALAIERAKRSSGCFALLMIDLDGFKMINDTYGHAAGDTVLIAVARRLTAALRASDTVARLGGDEFVAILEAGEDTGDASVVVNKLAQTVSEPIALDGGRLANVGISVGVALYPLDATDPEQLMMLADHAMYRAKAAHHTVRMQA